MTYFAQDHGCAKQTRMDALHFETSFWPKASGFSENCRFVQEFLFAQALRRRKGRTISRSSESWRSCVAPKTLPKTLAQAVLAQAPKIQPAKVHLFVLAQVLLAQVQISHLGLEKLIYFFREKKTTMKTSCFFFRRQL